MGKIYIEDTLNESKGLMERMGLIKEESISQKKDEVEAAIDAIEGKKNYVHTFCIITGQNPMGIEGSNNVNRTNNKKLRKILKAGHYAYVPVKGKYGNTEDSFIIFNLPLDNAKEIATETSQESFIFGRVEDDNAESAVFDLYVIDRSTGKYEYEETKNYHLKGSQTVVDDETGEEREDYYTQVGDKKFSVDFDYFKEGRERFNQIISEQVEKSEKYKNRVERFQECLIEEGRTGRSAYMNRSLIYGSLFSKLDEKENGNNM
jgi:hypothetical protein